MSVRSKNSKASQAVGGQQAIVIAAHFPDQTEHELSSSLAEVARLAATLGIEVVSNVVQRRVSLTGSLGQQSTHLSDLGEAASRTWAIGPSISWPLFDAGTARARVRVEDARQEQALLRYRKTVLTALQEVEDALSSVARERSRGRPPPGFPTEVLCRYVLRIPKLLKQLAASRRS